MTDKPDILRVDQLRIAFQLQRGTLEVVRGVAFRIPCGRTVALVGESGSGKTVISQAVMGLLPRAGHVVSGRILFQDPARPKTEPPVDIATMPRDGRAIRHLRGGRIGMIFQEPMSSLSPVHMIGDQIEEALRLHRPDIPSDRPARDAEIVRALTEVGITEPARRLRAYPHELSGGMAQRVIIAMALACRPKLLVADEPTTALDATVQRQIIDLFKELKGRYGMSILLITHNFGIIGGLADRVAVMFRGRLVE